MLILNDGDLLLPPPPLFCLQFRNNLLDWKHNFFSLSLSVNVVHKLLYMNKTHTRNEYKHTNKQRHAKIYLSVSLLLVFNLKIPGACDFLKMLDKFSQFGARNTVCVSDAQRARFRLCFHICVSNESASFARSSDNNQFSVVWVDRIDFQYHSIRKITNRARDTRRKREKRQERKQTMKFKQFIHQLSVVDR